MRKKKSKGFCGLWLLLQMKIEEISSQGTLPLQGPSLDLWSFVWTVARSAVLGTMADTYAVRLKKRTSTAGCCQPSNGVVWKFLKSVCGWHSVRLRWCIQHNECIHSKGRYACRPCYKKKFFRVSLLTKMYDRLIVELPRITLYWVHWKSECWNHLKLLCVNRPQVVSLSYGNALP